MGAHIISFRTRMKSCRTIYTIAIHQRHRRHLQFHCTLDQLLRLRRPPRKLNALAACNSTYRSVINRRHRLRHLRHIQHHAAAQHLPITTGNQIPLLNAPQRLLPPITTHHQRPIGPRSPHTSARETQSGCSPRNITSILTGPSCRIAANDPSNSRELPTYPQPPQKNPPSEIHHPPDVYPQAPAAPRTPPPQSP